MLRGRSERLPNANAYASAPGSRNVISSPGADGVVLAHELVHAAIRQQAGPVLVDVDTGDQEKHGLEHRKGGWEVRFAACVGHDVLLSVELAMDSVGTLPERQGPDLGMAQWLAAVSAQCVERSPHL